MAECGGRIERDAAPGRRTTKVEHDAWAERGGFNASGGVGTEQGGGAEDGGRRRAALELSMLLVRQQDQHGIAWRWDGAGHASRTAVGGGRAVAWSRVAGWQGQNAATGRSTGAGQSTAIGAEHGSGAERGARMAVVGSTTTTAGQNKTVGPSAVAGLSHL
jgi:hypothetical protein